MVESDITLDITMPQEIKKISELRRDPVSEDWVVIAPQRGDRPHTLQIETKKKDQSVTACLFCAFFKQPGSQYGAVAVVPNKYPAFSQTDKDNKNKISGRLFKKMPAIGFHEVIITSNHYRQIADLSLNEVYQLINIYQERCLALSKENLVNYIFIFQNHGPLAGATISHPHSQIITSPVVDCGFEQIIRGSEKFYQKHKKCVYCRIIAEEKREKRRLIEENKSFIAICPFASRISFEVMILPKKHSPHFANISYQEKKDLAEILRNVLLRIKKFFNDPAYNFYIRTAPCDKKQYPYFHWYVDILPKTQIYAGFELGAFMEIISVAPEQAALYLRKVKIA